MSVWSVAVVEGENNKELFLGREDGTLSRYTARMLTVEGGTSTLEIPIHSGAITAISAPTVDEVTTASIDGTVITTTTSVEVEGKREVRSVVVGTPLRCMLVTADQTFVAGHDGAIYSIGTEVPTPTKWEGHSDWVVTLAMTEAGYLLSGSYDRTVRVWDISQGKTVFVFHGHESAIKTIQSVGPYIYSAARDESVRLWAIPELSEGGEAELADTAAAVEVGEDGEPIVQEGATGDNNVAAEAIPSVSASAVIELPETPHSSFVSGNNIYIGFADGRVVTLNTKELGRVVQNYQAGVTSSYKKCKHHLEHNAMISVKNLKIRSKKSIKAKKNEVKETAANVAKAIAQEAIDARRAAAEAAGAAAADAEDEDEEGEEVEAEAEPELDEDGEEAEVTLTEEQEKEVADFVELAKETLETDTKKVLADKVTKVAALQPITQQKFLCEREKFDRVTFTRTYGKKEENAVVSLVVDGTTAYTTCGNTVHAVECRPGVLTL